MESRIIAVGSLPFTGSASACFLADAETKFVVFEREDCRVISFQESAGNFLEGGRNSRVIFSVGGACFSVGRISLPRACVVIFWAQFVAAKPLGAGEIGGLDSHISSK